MSSRIVLNDPKEGKISYDVLGVVEHHGRRYLFLFPQKVQTGNVIIMEEGGPDGYTPVRNFFKMQKLFKIFKKNNKDKFNFD